MFPLVFGGPWLAPLLLGSFNCHHLSRSSRRVELASKPVFEMNCASFKAEALSHHFDTWWGFSMLHTCATHILCPFFLTYTVYQNIFTCHLNDWILQTCEVWHKTYTIVEIDVATVFCVCQCGHKACEETVLSNFFLQWSGNDVFYQAWKYINN